MSHGCRPRMSRCTRRDSRCRPARWLLHLWPPRRRRSRLVLVSPVLPCRSHELEAGTAVGRREVLVDDQGGFPWTGDGGFELEGNHAAFSRLELLFRALATALEIASFRSGRFDAGDA